VRNVFASSYAPDSQKRFTKYTVEDKEVKGAHKIQLLWAQVVECLPSTCEILGPILSTTKEGRKERERKREREREMSLTIA
jgi:hypothetical protein